MPCRIGPLVVDEFMIRWDNAVRFMTLVYLAASLACAWAKNSPRKRSLETKVSSIHSWASVTDDMLLPPLSHHPYLLTYQPDLPPLR